MAVKELNLSISMRTYKPIFGVGHRWSYSPESGATGAQSGTVSALTSENVSLGMCTQRRLKSACTSAQSDQGLLCLCEETLHPWLSKMFPEKILVSLRKHRLISAHMSEGTFTVVAAYFIIDLER